MSKKNTAIWRIQDESKSLPYGMDLVFKYKPKDPPQTNFTDAMYWEPVIGYNGQPGPIWNGTFWAWQYFSSRYQTNILHSIGAWSTYYRPHFFRISFKDNTRSNTMNIRLSNVLTNDVDIIVQPLGIDDYTPIDENLGFSLVVSGVTYQLKYIQDVDIRYLLFDNASPSQIEIYSIEFSTTPFTSNAVVVPLNLPSASFFPNAWNSTTPSFSNNAYTIPDTSFDFTNPQGWVLNYRPQFVRFIFDRTLASSPIKVFIADAQGRFILDGDTMLPNNELVSGDMLNLSWLWYDVGGTQMLKGDIYSIHFQFANVNQVITLRDIEWFVGP